MSGPILPGAELGVLGGGQLGRMFTVVARRMGYRVTVFAPQAESPAGQLADRHVRAAYEDLDAVKAFAQSVAAVTFEFENVPSATAEAAAAGAPVRPAGSLLHATQNRQREKEMLTGIGLPVAPFAVIREDADLADAGERIGFPAVLKTSDWGYDGHGQRKVEDAAGLAQAWAELGPSPAVLEAWIPYVHELSVVGARGMDGEVALYDPIQNKHERHIVCRKSQS